MDWDQISCCLNGCRDSLVIIRPSRLTTLAGGSSQNVAKPAYRAFQLLRDAGDARLPVHTAGQALLSSPISVWATVDSNASSAPRRGGGGGGGVPGTRGLQIFASNFWPEALAGDPRPLNTTVVKLSVGGLPASVTSATLTRVDDNVTRPYFLWRGWDDAARVAGRCNSQCTSSACTASVCTQQCACLKYLSAGQLEQLQAASIPAVEAVAVKDGALRFSLAPYAIVRVSF